MHEDLLGYLLGALEPHEMRRIEALLEEDPVAQQELAELERVLRPLEESRAAELDAEASQPPPRDLVARTLANLPPIDAEGNVEQLTGEAHDAAGDDVSIDDAFTIDGALPQSRSLSLSSRVDSSPADKWRPVDWFASLTAVAVVLALTIPAVLEGRFAARKAACQDNLRQLGVQMTQFVNRNAQARLPAVAAQGHRAFAGVYAPRLREAGLSVDPALTQCPSVNPDDFGSPSLHAAMSGPAWQTEQQEVTLRMLDAAAAEIDLINRQMVRGPVELERMQDVVRKLRWMQETAGGHYAYTLGVQDGEQFSSPRYQGRSTFAVMSDAAMFGPATDTAGGLEAPRSRFTYSHGGRGINVLYEDGRIRFVTQEALFRIPDHPLLNNAGRVEAGLNIDDAVLAPSWQAPFQQSSQR